MAGLGNPGAEYARNRHNAGRLFIEFLIQSWKASGAGKKGECDLSRVDRKGTPLVFAAPRAYMNENGPPIAALLAFYKIPLDRLLVAHDEIDLPLGRLQLKCGGSSAGHRGVDSVYRALGSSEFHRLRIGVGRPDRSARDYVLSDFDPVELKVFEGLFETSIRGIDSWIEGDPARAARILNTPAPPSGRD